MRLMHIDPSTFRLKHAPRILACCVAVLAALIIAAPPRAAATAKTKSYSVLVAHRSNFVAGQQSKPTVRKRRIAEAVSPKVAAAEDAIDHKQYAQAESALKEATTEDPKDYRAWFDLAFVYGATNRKPEAIEAYKKSVAAKPDVFESNLNLGLMLSETQSPAAEQYLRAATKLKPQSNAEKELARTWFALGGVLKDKDPAGAADAFAESAKLDPTNPQPHVAAGNVLAAKGDVAGAEREYQQAAHLDPKSKEPVEALVDLYLKANRAADAEPALRKLLALDPNNLQAHIALSRVFVAEKKFDDAAGETNAVLKLDPNNQDAHKQALAIAIELKQYPQAIQQLRALVAQNPNDADLRYQLGNTLMRAKDFKSAQEQLIAAIKLKPDRGEAYGDLAVVAAENQNYDLVLKALDLRSRLLPEVAGTYFLRASAYDHLRQPKLAAENYHRFLEVANGKYPDEEWKARHRLIAIEPKK
jgi:tetratricopeptide (TPR) repeat protein